MQYSKNRKLLHSSFNLFLFLLFSSLLYSQTQIEFSDNKQSEAVDYNSFYPALMLKHNIGRFYKLPKNPVLSPRRSGWDNQDVADPFVLVTADSIFLFYDGSSKDHYSLGYAVRDIDGWGWVNRKHILQPDNQDWRSFHLIAPTIIQGKPERIVYNGNSTDSELGYQTGLAQKNNNGQWNFSSQNPLFKIIPDHWDYAGNAYQDIIYFPKKKIYKMWYSGFFGPFASIGLAESKDGTKWTKLGDKAVFESSPGVIAPEVVFDGEKYKMYFTQLDFNKGFYTEIKSADSKDGRNWNNIKTILKPEGKWEGKRLMRPNISFFEGKVHLFYCAQKNSKWQIGEAIAEAFFQSSGSWHSNEIKNNYNRLIIKYEKPLQTNIKIDLMDKKSGNSQTIDIDLNKEELRTDVYQSFTLIDKSFTSFSINVGLSTENELQSPVIYEIVLKEE